MPKLSKTKTVAPKPEALCDAVAKQSEAIASRNELKAWCVYMLELADGSLYCGVAAELGKRLRAHERKQGSKIVAAKLPFRVVYVEFVPSGGANQRSLAQKREHEIKQMKRSQKLQLIENQMGSGVAQNALEQRSEALKTAAVFGAEAAVES